MYNSVPSQQFEMSAATQPEAFDGEEVAAAAAAAAARQWHGDQQQGDAPDAALSGEATDDATPAEEATATPAPAPAPAEPAETATAEMAEAPSEDAAATDAAE